MAEEEEGGSPWTPLWGLAAFFVGLIALWFAAGGPNRDDLDNLFIQSPFGEATSTGYLPFGSGRAPGQTYQGAQGSTILIRDYYGAKESDPAQEYLVLEANPNNAGPIVISSWQLKSASGRSALIGGAIALPRLGTPQSNGTVSLEPGESAIISTGRSPVGMSFRENRCTGYFGQFQQFYPPLSQSCPYPGEELSSYNGGFLEQESDCVSAAAITGSCRVVTSIPSVSNACRQFLSERLTYNGCLAAHQGEARFQDSQWRVYLGLSGELWNNRSDVITLLDASGKLISSISY